MDTSNATLPRLLNRERFEREFGINWRHVLALGRDGLIPLVRFGRKVFIDRDQIDRLIASGGRTFKAGWRKEEPEWARPGRWDGQTLLLHAGGNAGGHRTEVDAAAGRMSGGER
jgi:hypothetical protein